MRADNKAFAKAVAPRKTIIFALQKSIKHLSLLVAFRQTMFQIKPLLSAKTLPVIAAHRLLRILQFQMTTDNKIYHYCKLQTAIELILPQKQLLLSSLNKTNDPRENKSFVFAAAYGPGSDFKDLYENNSEVSNLLRKDCKVICFSQGHNHFFGYEYSKMWAHYGENHKGICLLLDKEEFLKENADIVNPEYFKKVNYTEFDPTKPYEGHRIVDYNAMKHVGKEKYLKEHFRKIHMDYLYFTKDKEWESERESRLMHFSEKAENEYCSIKESLKQIYLGVDFNKHYLPSLTKLCPDIPISELDYTSVRLTEKEIYTPTKL